MPQRYTCPEPRPEDIAVTGVGCRLPGGVRDLDGLWRVLAGGLDVVTEVPHDRWDETFHDPDSQTPGTTYCHQGGFLTDIDRFDAEHFGISPREAGEMDPQQRLLLEVTAEAMENAGVPRERWKGSRTGVHLGILGSDYLLLHSKTSGVRAVNPYFAGGKEFSFAAGRIAYHFGLHGPAMTVNTACSSSLVAVHLACQSLRTGETDTALAGGVNAILTPELTVFMGKVRALSPTGRCRPFDAAADGVVRGEGCGVVVLRRYADALRDGDRIHGVIRGSAVNQDGYSAGLTAPNAVAQQMLLRAALTSADMPAEALDYVEAHGTGTPLGDPLEISALAEVIGHGRPDDRPLVVGSHKANFGHMDSAAGIVGLLKTLLVLRHRTAPPQIHHDLPSPLIDWDGAGIVVPTAPTPLRPLDGGPTAGVSAFGLSGTNAHVILTGPPGPERAAPAQPEGRARTLLLSATTAEGLRELAGDYRALLPKEAAEREPGGALDAVVAAAAVRRTHLRHRLAVVDSGADLGAALDAFRAGEPHPALVAGTVPEEPLPVVFVFSGQGSQYPGAGLDLYDAEPVFREALDRCDALVRERAGWSPSEALRDGDPGRLRRTDVAQPVVFAVQFALTRLLESWGVVPDTVIGHSMGEVAAACAAGALTLPDAVALITERGRLMRRAAGTGRMAAVELGAEEVSDRLADRHPEVCVATVNGPRSVVVAGPPEPMERAVAEFRDRGATTAWLPVEHAFHSPLMRPYAEELERLLSGVPAAAPRIPFLSTASPGRERTLDAAYWADNLRDPVLFWPAVDRWLADRDAAFVELGVHPVLGRPLRAALEHRGRRGPVTGTLARGRDGRDELVRARARLHVAGAPVDWSADLPGPVGPAELPPPRWADERHWLPGVERGGQSGARLDPRELRAEVRLFDARGRLVGEVAGGAVPSSDPSPVPPSAPAAPPGPAEGAVPPPAPGTGTDTGTDTGTGPDGRREQVAAAVHDALVEILGHGPDKRLPRTRGFFELGLDSVSVAGLAQRVTDALGHPLDAAEVLAHGNIDALTDHLLTLRPPLPGNPPSDTPSDTPPDTPPDTPSDNASDAAGPAPVSAPAVRGTPPDTPEPIAVVGIGCRLPGGVHDPASFWRLLADGTDATTEVPRERWDARAMRADGPAAPGTVVTSRGAFLDAVDGFDHGFFRVSPREARSMDPQQRLLLEVAWEALEDAGLPAENLRGGRTGVFVGLNSSDYQQLVTRRQEDVDLYYGTGNSFSGAAGRLSYFLGVHGPSMAVDTACSSSLTAVHLACQSLRAGESEVAVAGGANVMVTPTVFLAMSAAGALSPDGRCKTFDDAADGYGRGEGAGAVILKPLSTALRDGDRVYAVIRGSAVNQDGASGGLTVPSGDAQRQVIATALEQAGLDPGDVDYVEAHGTGTRLGDAVELRSLAAALGSGRSPGAPLLVGSAKTNVGHLEAAAGVVGLIKVALAMEHREIPAHLHLRTPTRQVDWDGLPIRVTGRATAWPRTERPRVAGVSAFGFTGTNAHLILQEPPERAAGRPRAAARPHGPYLLAASAAHPDALAEVADRLRDRVAGARDDELADLCWTAGTRRGRYDHRLAVVGRDRAELLARLAAAARGEEGEGVRLGTARPDRHRRLALLYGAAAVDLPWDELCAAAVRGAPTGEAPDTPLLAAPKAARSFSAAVREVDDALRGALDFSPLRAWESAAAPPEPGSRREAALVFAGQYAATALWRALGVEADVAVGSGIGEFAAGCAAGELTAADAAALLAAGHRSRPDTGDDRPAPAERLAADGVEVVLGIGAEDPAVRPSGSAPADVLVLHTPRRLPHDRRRSVARAADLLDLAATLYAHGCRVAPSRLHGDAGRVVSLPGYPWQRRSHWIVPVESATVAPAPAGPRGPAEGAARSAEADGSARPDTALAAEIVALDPARREERLLDAVADWAAEVLGGGVDVAPEQGFFDLGMDSVLSQQLKLRAEQELGAPLPGTVMFECPNALSFTRFLLQEVLTGGEAGAVGPDDTGRSAPPRTGDDLEDLDDEALTERALSLITTSEAMLTEGDRS
ncbi:acyltransferase domain-containing protein [Streptomyces sp. TRM43335]|uniref:Acyltransferase domain-containing protein n=1 Tax=Streptomyces taklimakanensis TaxID=2569853 RepID=A0A6G2BH72_9ACTN|nr:type I polyketide synthase [Streptomyces taklimakanensis]MTE21413.1 acyltransferase domain-containing protein [Streptomyces taklimakanensis]